MKRLLLLVVLSISFWGLAEGQVLLPPDYQNQIEELGLEEDEVQQALLEKGIDINNIDPSNISEVEGALEEVIAELTAEKAAAPPDDPIVTGTFKTDPPDTTKATTPTPASTTETESSTEEGTTTPKEEPEEKEVPKADVTGQQATQLEIYGHAIFSEKSSILNIEAKDVKAPGNYVLGPGDEIAVAVFGNSQVNLNFEINLEGYIQPPQMGRIYLKGMTLDNAKQLVRRKFGQYYDFGPGQFDMTLTYSKVITINVVGEVNSPGSVTIPATNTAFNALFAAGGPTDIGSVRQIKLLRNGQAPKYFDVYEFLKNPSVEGEFFLQNNDYLHVPIYNKLIAISGAVRKPMRYELVDGEDLVELINYAGGFLEKAYLRNIQVTRFINDQETIIDVDFRELMNTGGNFPLFSGDVVTVPAIAKPYENFVEVSGAVEYPGRFQLTGSMRISDLLNKGVMAKEARFDVAYLYRINPDETVRLLRIDLKAIIDNAASPSNIVLEPKDKVQVLAAPNFIEKTTVSAMGALREPATIDYDPGKNMRVVDLILLSNGLLPNAAEFAYLKRTDLSNKDRVDFIRVNLFDVLKDTTSTENRVLEPLDQLIVYTNEAFTDEADVVVTGAVRSPGEFDYGEGMKVADLVYFADGVETEAAEFAYINRLNLETKVIEYIRVNLKEALADPLSPENIELKPFDKLDVMSQTTFIDETVVKVDGAVRVPGEYPYDATLKLQDILTMAGGLKFGAASNRVEVSRVVIQNNQPTRTTVALLEVDENNLQASTGNAFQLEPYDHVIVRNVPDFKLQRNITLEGEVRYPGVYPLLSENERLSSLIERAGGLTPEAFADGAKLYRAKDGVGYIVMDMEEAMKKTESRYNYILKEGDLVTVPTKKDFVMVKGATKASELYDEEILKDGKLAVPFHKNRRARYYVNKYTAGIGEEGKASKITVLHPNGELKKTKNFGLFLIYPKVRKGSEITVGLKEPKKDPEEVEQQKEEIDWGKVVADSIAQATAILSLILLIQKVN